MNTYYAKYYKCALQVNPFSYSKYRGKDINQEEEYNKEILRKCQENKIDVVGLADHGSVDTSQSLREYLSNNGILTFPGFEISSAEKIHMVCLFPPEYDNSRLNQIIGQLGLPTNSKSGTDASSLTCLEIAKKIDENKILKYESISRKMSQAEADKLIEYANIKEKAEKYREAQKLNEAAQETYEQYQKNYKNLYIKIRELKKKADYQEADKLYQSAIQTSGPVTKHGYRESIEKLKKAQEIIPNFRDSKEKIAEYSKKAYVKYNISGCDNSHVPAYINGHLSKVGVYTKYSSEAEVQINCKVTDNYQVSTYPSQIKNLSQVKEVKNNDGQTVKKEFIFQESKTKSVEKLDFSYEIELSGYVKKKYSGNAYKQHEINSLQYLGNVPSEYSGKDKIEKLWGESEMRRKVYDSASFFKDLEDIVKELEKL